MHLVRRYVLPIKSAAMFLNRASALLFPPKKTNRAVDARERLAKMRDHLAEQTSLMNVEELLTDFNWKTSGNAAALERRLLGELAALEAVRLF